MKSVQKRERIYIARAGAWLSVFSAFLLWSDRGAAWAAPSADLDAPQPQARLEAIERLVETSGILPTARFLKRLEQEPDAAVRAQLIRAVTARQDSGTKLDDIEPYRRDPDAMVRLETVAGLGRLGGGSETREALQDTLSSDENAGVRMAAAFWLGSMRSPASVATLGNALEQDSDPNVRAQAARSLKWIGTGAARARLDRAKTDGDSRMRKIADEK